MQKMKVHKTLFFIAFVEAAGLAFVDYFDR